MPSMTCSQLLRFYKTKVAISKALGIDRQVVQGWFERGTVPLDQQTKLEVATAGELKAAVSDEFREVVARGQVA